MAKYKAYPEYKVSGVEWLGAIPKDWSVTKLKYIADLLTAKSNNTDDLFVGLENISSGDGKYISKQENIADGTSVSFEKNDVLFGKLRPYLAKSWLATFSGVCSSEFLVLRTAKLHPKYLNYYSLTNEFIEQVNSSTYGSKMPRASWEFIGLLPVPTCSYSLSEKVAWFLDHETAKIDELIEKQQQLIELLKEKRQAVISHAVTKGLNPDVPMKDSGVEWLGDVPEHWKLIKFSHCVSIRSGQVDPRKFPYCDYWLIAPNHIVSGEGRIINLETAKDQGADSGKYLCRTGEVIYSKIRPALVKACLSPSDTVLCSADMYPMTSYNGLTNNFLLLYLLSDVFTRFAVNQADRVAMPKINRESLSDCKIPVPPIDEQEKIYSHAREALEKLDVLLQKSQLTIEFFQERRTALISAAVTGKIDVRDWVAPDTQDAEEPQEATA